MVSGLLGYINLLSYGEKRRKKKNPIEKLIINKGRQGLPLLGDQPRT